VTPYQGDTEALTERTPLIESPGPCGGAKTPKGLGLARHVETYRAGDGRISRATSSWRARPEAPPCAAPTPAGGGGCRQRGPLLRDSPDGLSCRGWRAPLGVRETFTRNLSALLPFGRLNAADPDAPRTPASVRLFRTSSDSTRLLVAPLAQRLAETPCHPARDRLLYGSEDVGWETRGLCDRALQVDPVARR
jgi:hypothetical protein